MITIVDYGMGNLGSVQNMFKRIGVASEITGDTGRLDAATKLLLPGVGAFDNAMTRIRELGFEEILNRKVLQEKIPVMGICLGMQLLTNGSEEGTLPGLGWIPANTVRFSFNNTSKLKVPHMGWSEIKVLRHTPLLADLPPEARFYFVHSYYVRTQNNEDVLATSEHGIEFHSIIGRGNIYGAQFHPEKSHKYGMKLLENFAKI